MGEAEPRLCYVVLVTYYRKDIGLLESVQRRITKIIHEMRHIPNETNNAA